MFRKISSTFFAAVAFTAISCMAFAADPKGNAMGQVVPDEAVKVQDLYAWTPSSGAPAARTPFTTRYPARGRYVVIGDNQYSAATAFKILDRGGDYLLAVKDTCSNCARRGASSNSLSATGRARIGRRSARDTRLSKPN